MPPNFDKDVAYFGRTNFRNANRLFGVKRSDRRQHMYVVGKTGTGKTTLLHNLMVQDIVNGEGVCVVDPHGEFVESLLEKIPPERIDDVVYFNPSDTEFSIGFNPLELPDPRYKHLVASGLMGIFTKIWSGVWSARMEYILNNSILALLETPGSTLLGVTRLLTDKEFRQKVVSNVTDPVVKAFWINEFEEWKDQFRNDAISPIQNKVGQFLSTALIRNIVGQAKSTINIFDIMNTGKIFLVNVSKGRIGEDNSALLGSMIITTLQLSAMERVRIPENERIDFFLYVDEFQNFATDSFANILSEARKYRLDLTIAHQYIGQLTTDVSTKVRDAVFGNVGTMVVFRVGAADGEFLEKEFTPEFGVQDLVNLPNRTICLKLMVDGVASRPFSASTLPPFHYDAAPGTKERAIEASRKRYARPQWQIEQDIAEWAGITSGGLMGGKFEATCSHCGKQTYVPFEPQPGRPIYCGECLAKLKAGEISPARGGDRPPRALPRKDPYEHLTALGIGVEDSIPSPRAVAREQLPVRHDGERKPFPPKRNDEHKPRGEFGNTKTNRPFEKKPLQPREQFPKPQSPLNRRTERHTPTPPPHRPSIFEKIGTEQAPQEASVGLDALQKNEQVFEKNKAETNAQKPFGVASVEHESLAEALKHELQEALGKIKKEK